MAGWTHIATSQAVGILYFDAAFTADGESVWMVDGSDPITDNPVQKKDWLTLTDEDDFTPASPADFYPSGIAVDALDRLFIIGWNDAVSDRHEIWRFTFDGVNWVPFRLWNSGMTHPSPGAGNIPQIVYNRADDKLYFHHQETAATVSTVNRIDPDGVMDGPAETLWTSGAGLGAADSGITLTRDRQLMWFSKQSTTDNRVHSLDPVTDVVASFDSPTGGVDFRRQLAHNAFDPTEVVIADVLGDRFFQYPSDLSGETEVFYPEMVGRLTPTDLRGVAISHNGARGLMLVTEPTVSGGDWYRWVGPRFWWGTTGFIG